MSQKVYEFQLNLDWKLIRELSRIDKFGGSWIAIERREGQSLKQLKLIATVRSVGASTRIEGSKMTDDQVETLIKNLSISKLEERDEQEVLGYFEALDIIAESFKDIDISESSIKNLHNILMKHSKKDEWHKGDYKQHSNIVEATNADGSKYIIFRTTEPGFATEDAMKKLIEWYNSDTETHPIVRVALFVYEFLSIHPFQDGNGRLSRLIGTLLLLKHSYSWVQYVSFEHEIESRKAEYYKVLMQCQQQRPGETVDPWVMFFLDCLHNIQNLLMDKLKVQEEAIMSQREKKVYMFVETHPGCRSGEIAEKLDIPLPTVKKILTRMVASRFIIKHGTAAGTNYTIETMATTRKNLVYRFTNKERKIEFDILNPSSLVEINKIILTPLFKWVKPDEWSAKLINQGLFIRVNYSNNAGTQMQRVYSIDSYNNPYYFQPVFSLNDPIKIPVNFDGKLPNAYEYPLKVSIELCGSVQDFDFDVMLVYDSISN